MMRRLLSGKNTGKTSYSRRSFLRAAGATAALLTPLSAGAAPTADVASNWWRGYGRLVLQAEGTPVGEYVLPPLGPLPPAVCRLQFPWQNRKYLLRMELDITPGPGIVVPLAYATVEVQAAILGVSPVVLTLQALPSLAILGKVVAVDVVPSFFGDYTGAPFTLTTAYQTDSQGVTQFTFLGLGVAGSHTTVLPTATGRLIVRP